MARVCAFLLNETYGFAYGTWQYCDKIRLIQSKMEKLKKLSLMLLCAAMSLLFAACSEDEDDAPKLNRNELSLMAGQSAKLTYEGDCTWESDEPLIAEVDDDGNVTANRVGETTIWANDETCKVKVNPKYNTYMEPCMDWGASESEVANFMNGYENLGKDGNILSFADMANEIVYMYLFEDNSLKTSAIGANFMSKGEEITDFLLERYVVVDVDESSYTATMISIDKKIGVVFSINASSGLMLVMYVPVESNSTITRSAIPGLNQQIIQNNVIGQPSIDMDMLNDLLDKFKK